MAEYFKIENSATGLDELRVQMERIARSWNLTKRQWFEISLVVEEICVNYLEHVECCADACIGVEISLENSVITIIITDKGPCFDPTKVPDPDLCLPMRQRRPGGLGLYLVRYFTDQVSYRRSGHTNILTIKKRLQ